MSLLKLSVIGILLAAAPSAKAQTYGEPRWETPPDSDRLS